MEEAETTVRDFMASGGALKRLFERLPSFRCAVEPLLRFYRTNPALRGCNAAQIGAVGEVLAWAFLTQNGYRVRYHAMETPNHLVDLMVRTDRGLLGVEVRTHVARKKTKRWSFSLSPGRKDLMQYFRAVDAYVLAGLGLPEPKFWVIPVGFFRKVPSGMTFSFPEGEGKYAIFANAWSFLREVRAGDRYVSLDMPVAVRKKPRRKPKEWWNWLDYQEYPIIS